MRPFDELSLKIRNLLAGIALIFPLAALAADGSVADYRDASSKFASMVADAERAKNQDILRTEEGERLVAILGDEVRFLKPQAYRFEEMGGLLDLCRMSSMAAMSLLLFDSKARIDPQAGRQEATTQLISLMQQNTKAFEGQLRRLQPFSLHCLAKSIPAMTQFALSLKPEEFTEKRRKGLETFRAGLIEIFVGTLQGVGQEEFTEDFRMVLAQALADTAPSFAPAMKISVRREIRSFAEATAKSARPGFGPSLKRILEALDDPRCMGLCKL